MLRPYLVLAASFLACVVAFCAPFIAPPSGAAPSADLSSLSKRRDDLRSAVARRNEVAAQRARAEQSLWTASEIEALRPPEGWTFKKLQPGDTPGAPIISPLYAFERRDAPLEDYAAMIHFLKTLEGRESTRIESMTLTLDKSGMKFSQALVTVVLPVRRS